MDTLNMDIIQPLKDQIDSALLAHLPDKNTRPSKLHDAMHYSVMNGGKRVRALLLIVSAKVFPGQIDPIPAALAIELIHAYSLIHDDLPAMDNSDLRRGKPSCHIQFDEATAILAGDALLTEAFIVLAKKYKHCPTVALQLIQSLSMASGSRGIIAGQQEDIDNEGKSVNSDTLEFIHTHKTACLIQSAIEQGFTCGDQSQIDHQIVSRLGYNLGMAFQYQDDLLDIESNDETLGKPTRSDQEKDKLNAVKVNGLSKSKSLLAQYFNTADSIIDQINGNTSELRSLIHWLKTRNY